MKKYLQVIFISLSFLSITFSIGMHDLNYFRHASAGNNYYSKIYNKKTLFVKNFNNTLNNTLIIKELSYAFLSPHNLSIKGIYPANCLECQNIPASLFNIICYFCIVFIVAAIFYIFFQTLFTFPIIHPPKFSSCSLQFTQLA
ncbi:MAG: hypothetical protein ACYCTB_06930 [bacterium]